MQTATETKAMNVVTASVVKVADNSKAIGADTMQSIQSLLANETLKTGKPCDIDKVCELIRDTFNTLESIKENTQDHMSVKSALENQKELSMDAAKAVNGQSGKEFYQNYVGLAVTGRKLARLLSK